MDHRLSPAALVHRRRRKKFEILGLDILMILDCFWARKQKKNETLVNRIAQDIAPKCGIHVLPCQQN